MDNTRQNAIETSRHWWLCENILNNDGHIGLLRMDFPRVFLLIRDVDLSYWADFETWTKDIVEFNFFTAQERDEFVDDMEAILTEAWNFLSLTEEEEENRYGDML